MEKDTLGLNKDEADILKEMDLDGDGLTTLKEFKLYVLDKENKTRKWMATKAYIKDKIVDLIVIGIAIVATALTGVVLI